jgi:hypothetical protein
MMLLGIQYQRLISLILQMQLNACKDGIRRMLSQHFRKFLGANHVIFRTKLRRLESLHEKDESADGVFGINLQPGFQRDGRFDRQHARGRTGLARDPLGRPMLHDRLPSAGQWQIDQRPIPARQANAADDDRRDGDDAGAI